MRLLVCAAVVVSLTLLSGCIGEQPPAEPFGDASPSSETTDPFLIEWHGHIVHSALDRFAHMEDPEGIIFPLQQAGFLVDVPEAPSAIEVMVSWDAADAGFYLHPHYEAENDPALGGDTLYYGYFSDLFTESPGCIRIPEADMAAGVWPMMIHPRSGTMDVDYTITVGILNATGEVLPEMHGHRTVGDSPVEDHGVEPCRFLVDPAPVEAAA